MKMKRIIILFIFVLIGLNAFALDGTWIGGSGPSWQSVDNWAGIQPGGTDAIIHWSPINPANNWCTLGNNPAQSRTVGTMHFTASNTAGFNIQFRSLAGDTLYLYMNVSSGSAYISVHEDVGGSIDIGTTGTGTLRLQDDLIIDNSNATENITFDRPIEDFTGTNCIMLNGVGTTVFESTNTYAGGTAINNGTLSLSGAGTLGDESSTLYISSPGVLNIETGVSATVQFLVLDSMVQEAGTWGSTASGADYQNDTYFSGTGKITVSSSFVICDILAPDLETIAWRNVGAGIYEIDFCDIGAAPASGWVDTNANDMIIAVYGQDEQPAREIADYLGNTADTSLLNYSGTEPPNFAGDLGYYFWIANPYLVNTNAAQEFGNSFSNISFSYLLTMVSATAGNGLVSLDQLDGGQPELGTMGNGGTMDTRANEIYPGLIAGTMVTQQQHYAVTYDGLTITHYIGGLEVGTASKSYILDDTGCVIAVANMKGSQRADSAFNKVGVYNRTLASNEVFTLSSAGTGIEYDTISTNNLVLFYSFTNDVTRLADMSGEMGNMFPTENYGNTLTRVIAGTNANGVVQYAWDADGVDDKMQFTLNRHFYTSPLTMGTNDFLQSCWVYLRDNTADAVIVGVDPLGNDGYGLTVEASNSKFGFNINSFGTNYVAYSDAVAATNAWTHLVLKRFQGALTPYVNGVAQTNVVTVGADSIDLSTTDMITMGGGSGTYVDAIICEPLRIYKGNGYTDAFIGELYTNTGPTSIETRIDNR